MSFSDDVILLELTVLSFNVLYSYLTYLNDSQGK